jgi:hypothetical protein
MGAVIDKITGRVIWLPPTICCWPVDADANFVPVVFRVNSSLIVLTGSRNEKAGDQGSPFYRINGNHFIHIRDTPRL